MCSYPKNGLFRLVMDFAKLCYFGLSGCYQKPINTVLIKREDRDREEKAI
jgi:hypothetical protein